MWRQIEAFENIFMMRASTSPGVEKKNFGRKYAPPIGTLEPTYQIRRTATAIASWMSSSLARFLMPRRPTCRSHKRAALRREDRPRSRVAAHESVARAGYRRCRAAAENRCDARR